MDIHKGTFILVSGAFLKCFSIYLLNEQGRRSGIVVERRTPEREVGGSILTQVAVLYP